MDATTADDPADAMLQAMLAAADSARYKQAALSVFASDPSLTLADIALVAGDLLACVLAEMPAEKRVATVSALLRHATQTLDAIVQIPEEPADESSAIPS